MNGLLKLTRAIDALNLKVGKGLFWLVFAAVVISAANALVRKTFSMSSNAFLEVQWYLFAAVFLLGAGHVMLLNEHVRIDVVSQSLSRRTQIWIDIIGLLVFVIPLSVYIMWLTVPLTWTAYQTGEMSTNAGGLIRWPSYLMMPLGFLLLGLQAVSEIIKRIAFLRGVGPDPQLAVQQRKDSDALADDLRREAAAREQA
ncbi:MAG TPA: TRAP transporter small permease subunit [Quisquiliibacterium sp.]|nr:TRAP transporter small permease subunit [Quisquiliibacterium sp.]HPA90946.1 TRAP transporter small permease subunit [Quisquiliibacterium sp.]HQN12797.1 TRAP transporter small permease subunit [Quisquiliibacterium sp.]HQP65610.1 TRAP transporter small permease subunit [Quisquiliibacterium sp.]